MRNGFATFEKKFGKNKKNMKSCTFFRSDSIMITIRRKAFMLNEFSRMEILLGEEGVDCLAACKVAVFGLGGVGSYVAEALARCG